MNGSAIAEATHELLWVRGSDAVSYLDSLLSQDIAVMRPEQVARSLLLAPSGKLRALLWILRGESDVGVVADSGYGAQVAADLERFRLRVDATIEDELIPLFSVVGEATAGWATDGERIMIEADLGEVPRLLTNEIPTEAAVLAPDRAEALRIEAGEPRMGIDVDESTIPQESGLVAAAVDFDKGCYLGQELVARIDSRGHVNRRLALVVVGGDSPLPVGATVVADGTEAGVVTSVARSPLLDTHVGMGLLRREAGDGASVGIRWEGGSTTGKIHSLPLALHSANSH
ncbi:MAG: glycine cleavage T C-terminal barrel domain-containing protein [Acidimicrobiia bacterium]